MKRADSSEIRTEEDSVWAPSTTVNDPMVMAHSNETESCVDVKGPAVGPNKWQESMNQHRPATDKTDGLYYPVIKIYDDNGMILPIDEQVEGTPMSIKDAMALKLID